MKLKTILGIFFVFYFIAFVQALEKDNPTPYEKKIKTTPNVDKSSDLSQTQTPEVTDKKHLSKAPKPGTIVKESIDKETGAIILELSNGARVILKNMQCKYPSIDTFALAALAKGGTMAVTNKDDIPSARFASKILRQSRVGPYFDKLNDCKLKKKIFDDFNIHIEAFERSIEGETWSYKDPEPLFELIYLRFTCQEIESDKVNDYIKSHRDGYRNTTHVDFLCSNNPHFNFDGSPNQSRFNSDPFQDSHLCDYKKYFEVTDYPKITPERALNFLKKCFNPADFTFVFAGNIDTETFKIYVKKYIASIPRSAPLTNQRFTRPTPSKVEFYEEDDKNCTHVDMHWIIDQKYSPKMKATLKVFEQYIYAILNNTSDSDNNTSDDDHSVNDNGCECYINPFFDELCITIWNNWYDFAKPNKYISKAFKHMQSIAQGNIDTDVLLKAKNATVELYGEYSYDSMAVCKRYACSAVWNKAPLSESEKFPFVCKTVSKQDLKDMAGRLLKGKYYQRIVYHKKLKSAK
ncbi:hypothetical protein AGMMS50222_06550 [Endomicrobiia bacterium]|nr:hypothetical protein AGMMS49556_05050 [Endomicrobiia bacterium]GHT75491.1 hypothetical protein AGMMS50222_06550 [Endomicrobiia bacterium]